MIRIAIVEDDLICAQLLQQYLDRISKETERTFHVTHYETGEDLLEQYKGQFDLILMDIEMPYLDGMKTAEQIRRQDQAVAIIFVTNMAQYAIRGYEVNAIDFMLKPVSYFNFAEKLERALRFSQRRGWRNILLSGEDGVVRFPASELQYVEKDRDYLLYHTDTAVYCKRGTMKAVREELAGLPFWWASC